MASEALVKVVEQQEVLDRLSDQIQPLVHDSFKAAGPTGREVKNFLHGTWLGHPLHPALTDVPLGAWTAAAALDAMESISGRREFGSGADVANLLVPQCHEWVDSRCASRRDVAGQQRYCK